MSREPFRGAPTRSGRVLAFFFGLPFALAGFALGGYAGFVDEPAGERLGAGLGAIVFLAVGLTLWSLAFPGAVNRIAGLPGLRGRSHRIPALAMGAVVLVMGTTPMLMALGVIPADRGPTPRWVGIVAASIFLFAALFVLLRPAIERLPPRLARQVTGAFPMIIVTGMAVVADWIAFGAGERVFGVGTGVGPISWWRGGGELGGRVAFGLGGVFLSVVCAVGWWKYLRNDW